MKIRAIYQPTQQNPDRKEVIMAIPNDSNEITTTGQAFAVGEADDLAIMFAGKGVDFSLLWRDGLIARAIPSGSQYDIDACPLNTEYTRKVFVLNFNVEQNNEGFWFNVVVRHFLQGAHTVDPYDDIFVTTWVDNSVLIDGVGEYDYFIGLLRDNNSLGIEEIEAIQIPNMEQNGRFGSEIYPQT